MKSIAAITALGVLLATHSMAAPDATPAPPVIREIRLSADSQKGIEFERGKAARVGSNHANKIKITPGLTDPSLVSLESADHTGFYIAHQKFVLYLYVRPKPTNLRFEASATFKMAELGDGKVQFEASNYPGMFITARSDGSVILARNPPAESSTFILKEKRE